MKKVNEIKKINNKKPAIKIKKQYAIKYSVAAENFLATFSAYADKTRDQVIESFILQKELESRVFTVAGILQKLKPIFFKMGLK